MPTSFQDICEGDEIGLHIIVWVVDAVADPGLCREMNDPVEAMLRETSFDRGMSARFARIKL